MKQLQLDIIERLSVDCGYAFVDVWNNQLDLAEEKMQYPFDMPAAFVEFVNEQEIIQLGDGVQIYDPLIVRIHICHYQLASLDGTMQRNMDVEDLTNVTYKRLQRFEPDGAVAFCRMGEERDYTHTNVYHMIQDYRTNYIDASAQVSTDGDEIVLTPKVVAQYSMHPYLKGIPSIPKTSAFNKSFNLSFK